MNYLKIALSLCLLAASVPQLNAQESRLSLDQALGLFAVNNLNLRLARARVAEATGLATQAEAFPNPSITATYEPLSSDSASYSESYLNLSQRFELPAKRGARSEAGDRIREAALAGLRADSVRLAFEVKRAYVLAALGDERLAVTERVAAVFREANSAATARYQEGDVSLYDVRRIAVERALYENLTADAALESAAAGRALAQLVSPEEEIPGLATDPLPETLPPEVPSDLLASATAGSRAELTAARAEVDAATAQARLARAERLPDISATGGYKRQLDGLHGAFLGLSIPLPLFDRNAGGIQAADARATGAEERFALTRRQVEDDLSRTIEAYGSLRARAVLFTEVAAGAEIDLLAVARVAYEAGEMSLVQLLDAAGALHQARTAEARLKANVWIAYYDLERAVGGFGSLAPDAALENRR